MIRHMICHKVAILRMLHILNNDQSEQYRANAMKPAIFHGDICGWILYFISGYFLLQEAKK